MEIDYEGFDFISGLPNAVRRRLEG